MATGWVSIYRDLQDHWLWDEKPFSRGQAWIDLILLADHQPCKIPYKGDVITTERGTVNRSILSLSERWGWSRCKTRQFLNYLEEDGMIRVFATTNRTTITIVNYDKFQDEDVSNRQRVNNEQTARRQRADTYNNANNANNANKYNTRAPVRGGAADDDHLRRLAR